MFRASVQSRPHGPALVPGVFVIVFLQYGSEIKVQIHKLIKTKKLEAMIRRKAFSFCQ